MLNGLQMFLRMNLLDSHRLPSGAGMMRFCVIHISHVKKLNRGKFAGFS